MKISLSERIVRAYQENKPIPLKGTTRIILRDKDGNEEVTESHNLVTDAVSSILSSNWGLLGSMKDLLPLKRFFSGCLLFHDNITESASNYNPPSDTNKLVCHAGDAPNETASTLRGSPNAIAYEETDTSVKFVWDFPLEVGNDTSINCVCLCPGDMGNMGLKPFDNTLNVLSNYAVYNDLTNTYSAIDETNVMRYPISIDDDGHTGKAIYWSGTSFKEITVGHDWLSWGITKDNDDWFKVSERTATVRATNTGKGFIFQDDTYYYCCAVTSATTIQIDKVAKSNMAVTTADITVADVALYTTEFSDRNRDIFRAVAPWPYDGTYLYLPNSDLTKLVKVNIGTPADTDYLDGTISGMSDYVTNTGTRSIRYTPLVINSGLVWFGRWFINNGKVYDISTPPYVQTRSTLADGVVYVAYRKGASCYAVPFKTGIDYNFGQGPVILGTMLTTINNLPSPGVTKTSIKTMRVEYLVEEDDGE